MKPKHNALRSVTFHLPPALYEALDEYARARGQEHGTYSRGAALRALLWKNLVEARK